MLVYAALIALIISCGTPYAASMSNSLSLVTESNALGCPRNLRLLVCG